MEKNSQNSDQNFKKIDCKSKEILDLIKNAPVYHKFCKVEARKSILGEKIITILADGRKETENIAKEGDWVVTNPDGEEYILSEKKFLSRDTSTNKDGVFIARGFCKAVKNPYSEPIEIMDSWGSVQRGGSWCFIADTCDVNGITNGEPYLIDELAFNDTYKIYKI